MAIMIQISEDKIDELAEGMENMLHAGGKLMSCINRLREEGKESKYGRRMNRSRYGRRDDEDWDDEEDEMSSRKWRDGRYM